MTNTFQCHFINPCLIQTVEWGRQTDDMISFITIRDNHFTLSHNSITMFQMYVTIPLALLFWCRRKRRAEKTLCRMFFRETEFDTSSFRMGIYSGFPVCLNFLFRNIFFSSFCDWHRRQFHDITVFLRGLQNWHIIFQ